MSTSFVSVEMITQGGTLLASSNLKCRFELLKPKAVASAGGQLVIVPGSEPVTPRLVHVELANLRDDDKTAARFLWAHGPLLVEEKYRLSNTGAQGYLVGPVAEAINPLLETYPNADFYLHTRELLMERSWLLRHAWDGNRNAVSTLEQYLDSATGLHFQKGSICITARSAWTVAVIMFLYDYSRNRIARCENPDCPAPYFIRKRNTQKFCEAGPCADYGARQRAKRWWKEFGNDWRKGRKA